MGLTPYYARLLMDPLVHRVTVTLGLAHLRKRHTLRCITHTTILFSMPEKDLACPNMKYVKCSIPKMRGCPTSVAFCSMEVSMPFSGYCHPQPSAQHMIHHIRQSVSHQY